MSDPLQMAITLCALCIVACYVLSLITGNYSQVDRLWSIIPIAYVAIFAWATRFGNLRLDIMMLLVFAWGGRLTMNFARKGGYQKGHEDYRWPILRKRFGPVRFQIFNATFIAPYQNILLLLISLPAYVAWLGRATPMGQLDVAAAVVFVIALVGETVADQQQWDFHQLKKEKAERGETIEPPFLTTGLFRFSRHPNFFFEQLQWWCLYVFGVAASGSLVNWGLPGPVLLTLLFHGSSNFTEELSITKYATYADYQRRTSRQIPWFS